MFADKKEVRMIDGQRNATLAKAMGVSLGDAAEETRFAEAENRRSGETAKVAGLIDIAMSAAEDGVEHVMKEIAILADQLGPILSIADGRVPAPTAYGERVLDVGSEDSPAAQRICDQARGLTEVARAIEALRRRIQL